MARLSYEEYLQLEQQREERQNKSKIRFLSLKNDGDEAIVRFAYSSPSELKIDSVHSVKLSSGSYRKVNCIRSAYEPLAKCPLCDNENKPTSKIFVLLTEYQQDDKGNIVAIPSIWERPVSYIKVLRSYMDEYGDISDMIFKLKRVGAAGNLQTTYNTLPVNMSVYKPEIYKKDFSEFENYSILGHVVLDKNYEEMAHFVEYGDFPQTQSDALSATTQQAPVSQQAPQQQAPQQQYVEPQYKPRTPTYQNASQNNTNVSTPSGAYQQPQQQVETPSTTKPRRYTY